MPDWARVNSMIYTLFYKQHFYKQHQAEIRKKSSESYTNPEVELLLFENYSLSSSMLLSKTNMRYFKKCAKNKCAWSREIMYIIITEMRLKMKKESQR